MRFLAFLSYLLAAFVVLVVGSVALGTLASTGLSPAELLITLVCLAVGYGLFSLGEWLRARGAMRFLAPISSILFVLCVWVVIGGGARVLFTTGVGPAELFGLLVWAAIGFGFFRLAEWLRARGARGAS